MADGRHNELARLAARLRPSDGEQVIVAFQGELGAYGHLAIEQVWGARAWVLSCTTFAGVVTAVERGKASYAVLPVRNAIIGDIPGVAAVMGASSLEVMGEIRQEVRHCLLVNRGSELSDIRDVFSHPAALAQCAAFFQRHRALVSREATDTAGAAREVAERARRNEAAIADEGCASRYGLRLLLRGVGDSAENVTTFAVVRRAG